MFEHTCSRKSQLLLEINKGYCSHTLWICIVISTFTINFFNHIQPGPLACPRVFDSFVRIYRSIVFGALPKVVLGVCTLHRNTLVILRGAMRTPSGNIWTLRKIVCFWDVAPSWLTSSDCSYNLLALLLFVRRRRWHWTVWLLPLLNDSYKQTDKSLATNHVQLNSYY